MDQALNTLHNPVLGKEVIAALNVSDGQVIVDGTLGLGGYSEMILDSGKKVKIAAFDLDEQNLQLARERLAGHSQSMVYFHDNFANLKADLSGQNIDEIDGLMLDLGLASTQVDQADRGFSFNKDAELDMRFDRSRGITAREVVNDYSPEELTRIFREYGEENKAWKVAQAIAERRKEKKFTGTLELAGFIEALLGGRKGRIHPATKVFQALRMEVNRELQNLETALSDSLDLLKSNGRIAVVSYHSLEDRIVKNFFREHSREYVNLPDQLTTTYLSPKLKIITKKPIVPSAGEIQANPRARSAKLRVAEKI
jgi:16S rRNA (cytosine1402-N4)-methyltransferase